MFKDLSDKLTREILDTLLCRVAVVLHPNTNTASWSRVVDLIPDLWTLLVTGKLKFSLKTGFSVLMSTLVSKVLDLSGQV